MLYGIDCGTHVENGTTEETNELENHVLLLSGQFVPAGGLAPPLDLHGVEAVSEFGVEPVCGGDEVAELLARSSTSSLPPWLLFLDCLLLDLDLGVGVPVSVNVPDQTVYSVRTVLDLWRSRPGDLRSVFIHVLGTAALGGTDVQVGVHVLGFREEVTRLQVIVVLLPQRLGSMRGTVLAESHNFLEVRSHMPESYRPAVEKKKNNKKKRRKGEERRGDEGEGGEGMRVRSRTDLEMGRRVEEFLIC